MIHVDTSFLIQALVHGSASEGQLQSWIAQGEPVGISAVAWSEFLCGPLASADKEVARVLFGSIEPLLAYCRRVEGKAGVKCVAALRINS